MQARICPNGSLDDEKLRYGLRITQKGILLTTKQAKVKVKTMARKAFCLSGAK